MTASGGHGLGDKTEVRGLLAIGGRGSNIVLVGCGANDGGACGRVDGPTLVGLHVGRKIEGIAVDVVIVIVDLNRGVRAGALGTRSQSSGQVDSIRLEL